MIFGLFLFLSFFELSSSSSENEEESVKNSDDSSSSSNNDDDDEEENNMDDDGEEKNSGDEIVLNEQPIESGINWNVRNRPQRDTHLIRFNNITQQDGIKKLRTIIFF